MFHRGRIAKNTVKENNNKVRFGFGNGAPPRDKLTLYGFNFSWLHFKDKIVSRRSTGEEKFLLPYKRGKVVCFRGNKTKTRCSNDNGVKS